MERAWSRSSRAGSPGLAYTLVLQYPEAVTQYASFCAHLICLDETGFLMMPVLRRTRASHDTRPRAGTETASSGFFDWRR
jgi:hypothetical protein